MDRMTRVKNTPWGRAQHVEALIPGQVFSVSTMGHGGLYVCGAAFDRIPESFRAATFTRDPHWFEEDVDWAIVAFFIPEAFPNAEVQAQARAMLEACHGPVYRAWKQARADRTTID